MYITMICRKLKIDTYRLGLCACGYAKICISKLSK